MNAQHKWQPEDALDPEFVSRVLGNPKITVEQASYSAQALEEERRDTLRDDLMRKLRENKDERERLEAAISELDALGAPTESLKGTL